MATDLTVSRLFFGRSLIDFVAGYGTIPGAIGLAAPVAFGLMPIFRAVPRARRQ
jgi:hypothetical protein